MLTPIEIQGKTFKTGTGYDKKDVELFFKELYACYETIYKENVEFEDKINTLSDGIQYYKSIEKTLQKALVLAEKTAEETEKSAKKNAEVIIQQAHCDAKEIVLEAQKELDRIHLETINMAQQCEKYKASFRQLANTQLELLNSDIFNISIDDLIGREKAIKSHEDKEAIRLATFVNKPHTAPIMEEEDVEEIEDEDSMQTVQITEEEASTLEANVTYSNDESKINEKSKIVVSNDEEEEEDDADFIFIDIEE